jgi:hypothetical protein
MRTFKRSSVTNWSARVTEVAMRTFDLEKGDRPKESRMKRVSM